jgi:hypothetical protein
MSANWSAILGWVLIGWAVAMVVLGFIAVCIEVHKAENKIKKAALFSQIAGGIR